MVANLNLILISILTPRKFYFTNYLKAEDLRYFNFQCLNFHIFNSHNLVFSLCVIILYPHSLRFPPNLNINSSRSFLIPPFHC